MKLPTLRPETSAPVVDWAIWWAREGWKIHPCRETNDKRAKSPYLERGHLDATLDPDQIRAWWGRWPGALIGGVPPAGWALLDGDPRHNGGIDPLADWPPTLELRSGRNDGGRHLIYADPEGRVKHGKLSEAIDVRSEGKGYAILPPSLHPETRLPYTVHLYCDPSIFPYDRLTTRVAQRRSRVGQAAPGSLAALLKVGPADPEFGDDKMTQVAGHLAKRLASESEYMAVLSWLNWALEDPMDESAVEKKRGIWAKEREKIRHDFDAESGWLVEGTDGYLTKLGDGDKIEVVEWSDFKITAHGLIVKPEQQVWLVDLHMSDGSTLTEQRLPSEVLSSVSRLRAWLMARGCTLHTHRHETRGHAGERLLKMMRSQGAREMTTVPHFGWSPEHKSFLTPTGIIVPGVGAAPYADVVPEVENDHLQLNYGTDVDIAEAWSVLRRVLTFHDEIETAKIGAWMMMLILRGQYQAAVFPVLLAECYSESAKSTLFGMVTQLMGAKTPGGGWTVPAARDAMAASSNSPVWMDDHKMNDELQELIRLATTGGSKQLKDMTKPGSTKSVHMKSGLIISHEGITGYTNQKANVDRVIPIELTKVTDRRSLIDPSRLQYEDVKALLAHYENDLTRVAGSLVAGVLALAPMLSQLPGLATSSSRQAQNQALLRMGARILDAGLPEDEGKYAALVDQWAGAQEPASEASYVVHSVIPTVWMTEGMPTTSTGAMRVPAFLCDGVFWVHSQQLAEVWSARRTSSREQDITSETAIRRELRAIGATGKHTRRVGSGDKYANYWRIPAEYTDRIVDAAGAAMPSGVVE